MLGPPRAPDTVQVKALAGVLAEAGAEAEVSNF